MTQTLTFTRESVDGPPWRSAFVSALSATRFALMASHEPELSKAGHCPFLVCELVGSLIYSHDGGRLVCLCLATQIWNRGEGSPKLGPLVRSLCRR